MLQTLNRQEKQRLHSKFLTTLTIHKKSIVLEVIPHGAPPFFFFSHRITSQILKCDIMKRQLLELWKGKWKRDTYVITFESNSISSQRKEKEKSPRESI